MTRGAAPGSIPSRSAWGWPVPGQAGAGGFALGTPGNWYAPGIGGPARTVLGSAVPGSIPSRTAWDWEVPEVQGGRGGGAIPRPGWTTWGEQFGQEDGRREGGGGGERRTSGGGRWRNNAPAGVDQKWWDDFTEQHEGQNPLDYYGEQGEGLAEAMGDLEWSQNFQEMYGRPPSDDDWRLWWFQKRGLPNPDRPKRRQAQQQVEQTEERPPLWVPPMIVWR